MATIPERSRQRLASSVVGTLGVDTTQAQIFASGARTALTLADAAGKRQRDRERQSARRDTFVNRTNANRRMVDFNRGLNRIGADAKNQKDYNDLTDELFNTFSGEIESDEERAHFVSSAGPKMIAKGDRFFIKNEQDKVNLIQENLNTSIDALAEDVVTIFGNDQARFGDKLLAFADIVEDASTVVGDARGSISEASFRQFSKEAVAVLATEGVLALMDSNPEQVEPFLDSLEQTDLFTQQQVGQIIDQANQYARKQTELRNRTAIVNNSNIESDILIRQSQGEQIRETDINRLLITKQITATQAKAIRGNNVLNARVFKGNTAFTYNQLLEDYKAISFTKEKTTEELAEEFKKKGEETQLPLEERIVGAVGKKIRKATDVSPRGPVIRPAKVDPEDLEERDEVASYFAQISVYRQRVMEAREKGTREGGITDKQAEALLKVVNPIFRAGVESTVDELIRRQTFYRERLELPWFVGGDATIVRRFPGVRDLPESEIADIRMNYALELMQRIDVAENKSPKPLSNVELTKIVQDTKEEFSLRSSTDKSKLKIGDILDLPNGTSVQVKGFYLDGEANYEIDPDKFIKAKVSK